MRRFIGCHCRALPLTASAQKPAKTAEPFAAPGPVPTNKDVASTQRQLIELLRLSPTLGVRPAPGSQEEAIVLYVREHPGSTVRTRPRGGGRR